MDALMALTALIAFTHRTAVQPSLGAEESLLFEDTLCVLFIYEGGGLLHEEHPVIQYYRHTYDVDCHVADTFTAGGAEYRVYQLR